MIPVGGIAYWLSGALAIAAAVSALLTYLVSDVLRGPAAVIACHVRKYGLECTEPAYIAHPEHAYAGIAPGTHTLRRQREQADEERFVAD